MTTGLPARDENGQRISINELNGRRYVALDLYCSECSGRDNSVLLARICRSTFEGADPAPWVASWEQGGARVVPLWSFGPDGRETLKLACNVCGHEWERHLTGDEIGLLLDTIVRDTLGRGAKRMNV